MDEPRKLSALRQKRLDRLVEILDRTFSELTREECPKCKDCCCSECSERHGWRDSEAAPQSFLKKKYGFNKTTGFLTSTGCGLPRQFRSRVCLNYCCSRFLALVNRRATILLSSEIKYAVITTRIQSITPSDYIDRYINRIVHLIIKIRGW